MYCPECHISMKVKKARLDVYWCENCQTSWLIHKLSYNSFEEASKTPDYSNSIRTVVKVPKISPAKHLRDLRVPPKQ